MSQTHYKFARSYYPPFNCLFFAAAYPFTEIFVLALYMMNKEDPCTTHSELMSVSKYIFIMTVTNIAVYSCIYLHTLIIYIFGETGRQRKVTKHVLAIIFTGWRYFLGVMTGVGVCLLLNTTCEPFEDNGWYLCAVTYTLIKFIQFVVDCVTIKCRCNMCYNLQIATHKN